MSASEYERYLDRWSRQFPEPREVGFSSAVLRNAYCPDCRFCCAPQPEGDKPFPMALLDRQVSARTPSDFWLLDSRTACLDQRGCRALTPSGCSLENALRPVACNLFPFVVVDMRLYLYLICPASMLLDRDRLKDLGRQVHQWLLTLPRTDAERISISVDQATLAARYLDLDLDLRVRQGHETGALDEK